MIVSAIFNLQGVTALAPRFPYKEQILRVSVDEAVPIGTTVARVQAGGTDYSQHVNYSMQAWRATVQVGNETYNLDTLKTILYKFITEVFD